MLTSINIVAYHNESFILLNVYTGIWIAHVTQFLYLLFYVHFDKVPWYCQPQNFTGKKNRKLACTFHTLAYSLQSLWKIFSPTLSPSPPQKEEQIMAAGPLKAMLKSTHAMSVLVSVPGSIQWP